jgi:cytochrome b561
MGYRRGAAQYTRQRSPPRPAPFGRADYLGRHAAARRVALAMPGAPFAAPRVAPLERALARCTHVILYFLLIAMPLAAYVNAAAAGYGVSVFGLFSIPPLTPENGRRSQAAIGVHVVAQYFAYLL